MDLNIKLLADKDQKIDIKSKGFKDATMICPCGLILKLTKDWNMNFKCG